MDTITSTLDIARSIYGLISGIKNGPDHIRRATESLHQFAAQLEQIQHFYGQDGDGGSFEHTGLLRSVRASVSDLNDFSSKLQKIQLVHGENVAIKTWKRLRTAVTEKDLDNIARTISQHRTQIDVHLSIITRKAIATLTAQGAESRAESSAAFRKLEQTTSTLQQGAAVSHTQLQDVLCQIKQLVQNTSPSRSTKASGIIGEVNDDGSMSADNDGSATASQETANRLDADLLESIEWLGKLVNEKERTFGYDDGDYDTIIQSVGNILKAAKRHAADTAQDTLARAIAHFTKGHGSYGVILNSQDQATSRQSKRKSGVLERDLMCHEIPLATGHFMFKRRRTTRMEPSDADSASEGSQKDCVTTATFLLNNTRSPCMITAADYLLQPSKRQGVFSISYLSINPVLPTSSRVFQVVEHGNVQELREMLQNGEASLRDTDENGLSLLHFSAQQPPMTQYLLKNGLDVDHIGLDDGLYPLSALQYLTNDSETDDQFVRFRNECREILLDAGSDPLADYAHPGETDSFLISLASDSMNGECARFAKRAVSQGLISIEDVLNHTSLRNGDNLLHRACVNSSPGSTVQNIAAILNLGFDINAANLYEETCLYQFSQTLGFRMSPFTALRDQSILVFLLRKGADPYQAPTEEPSISFALYHGHVTGFCRNDIHWKHGSYCADVWDSALYISGRDILEHRAGHTRRPEYTAHYTREIFELLWEGRENECPYWVEEPWPGLWGEHDGDPLHLPPLGRDHIASGDEESGEPSEGDAIDEESLADKEDWMSKEMSVDEEHSAEERFGRVTQPVQRSTSNSFLGVVLGDFE